MSKEEEFITTSKEFKRKCALLEDMFEGRSVLDLDSH